MIEGKGWMGKKNNNIIQEILHMPRALGVHATNELLECQVLLFSFILCTYFFYFWIFIKIFFKSSMKKMKKIDFQDSQQLLL